MKNILKIFTVLLAILSIVSCKTEFENHNAASEDAVYNTPEAYPGIVLGMTKHFIKNSLYEIARGPGVVAREIAATNTYTTENELESGDVPNDNASIARLWRTLHYERGVAEKIIANIDDVKFVDDDEKAGIKAYAKFFEGMTTAYLAFYWEKATKENNAENQAEFFPRADVLNKALADMDAALSLVNGNPDAASYINLLVSDSFSIVDAIQVFRARIYMELGDYQNAVAAANAVDPSAMTVWTFENTTSGKNPIWTVQYDASASERWKAVEDMGVSVEAGDGRLDFYLNTAVAGPASETCGFNTNYIAGFWDNPDENIPVFLPDEVKLIKAEAYAQMGNLSDAVALIDEVRQDTSDIYGVNAGLGAWAGDATNQQEVLDEIYYNYAMELYLSGLRWLAHKRIYPNYLSGITPPVDCSKARTRNYFPYPYNEQSNNPNTPDDPSI